ncbi:MAG: flagellar hook-length control protein FliK [Campylobacterota bacterium]|nr:flagellar hook-length control protein FliK [Campylobacterota bacterium]
MNISTTTLLNILSPNINNTVKQKIESLSKDGKVDIQTLVKDKSIQSLISGLFKDIALGTQTKDSISTLLQNNKNTFSFKNLSDDIKSLVKFLETQSQIQLTLKPESKILNQISALKESIVDIKNIDVKILKENISNSGVFLESKLLKNELLNRMGIENNLGITKNISRDIKMVILQIQEQISGSNELVGKEIKATVEKILSQVEYFQLLSYSSNSNHTYLSFLQENIEDVDIKLNSLEDDSVSCQINLTLKKQGELKVLLVLDKKNNLNINIGVENFDFKEKIQNNLQKLRIKINSIGLMLQSLNVFDINQDNSNNELAGYSDNKNINFGLDIKA